MNAPELDLFGDVIPTYDTKIYTPVFFAEMHRLIDAGRKTRAYHAWLEAQEKRWSKPTFEKIGNGMIRVTQWKD